MKEYRHPAVAGMFYPGAPRELQNLTDQFLLQAGVTAHPDNVRGLVIPHAGYIYSGLTAAYAYNAIDVKKIKTVIILSPSHQEYFPGICIYDGDGYETPLGVIRINKEKAGVLVANEDIIFMGKRGHRKEHAIEVHLPFLQRILPQFDFVPVVMGDQSDSFVRALARKLPAVMDEETVIIASSDLSHFYSKEVAGKFDSRVAKHLENYDYETLQNELQSSACHACGGGLIVSMMQALEHNSRKKMSVLHRSDSGDVSGDNDSVVGYLSAVIC